METRIADRPCQASVAQYAPGDSWKDLHAAADRPRHRQRSDAQAAHRRGRRDGDRRAPVGAVRRDRRQDQAGRARRAGRRAQGPVRRRLGGDADAARRGQDGDHGRPRAGVPAHRPHRDRGHPAAVDGAHLRHQGRGGRRRLQPGGADAGPQPPPDRRLPRRDRGEQPAGGSGRQPPAPGKPRGAGPVPHHLAPGARRQRPGVAGRRHRPG